MPTLPLDTNNVPYQAWDSSTALSPSGLALTRGVSQGLAASFNASSVAPGVNVIPLTGSKGFKRRSLTYNWSGNAILQVLVGIQTSALNYPVLAFTVPAGNTTVQQGVVNSGGATQQSGSAPTLTNGSAYASIDAPSEQVNVFCFATGATTGTLTIEFEQTT